ncbi:non-ribosomal peptide synthetase [Streptomyces sp. NPDC019224]|uniref:non-ribosomal peptide synthetase n=1 Tax=Streptomyces sp. NPDC019224 TaxID=3154484 RepID=UPI003408F547
MQQQRVVVHELFAKAAAAHPHRPALRGEGEDTTYRELDRAANALAWRLTEAGVRPGDRVAVLAHRTPPGVVGLLGTLKAGAVCVPVDGDEAPARVQAMLETARPTAVVVAGTGTTADTGTRTVVRVPAPDGTGEPTGPAVHTDDTAPGFVFFTSGSTGRPQAVVHSHRSAGTTLLPELCGDPLHPEDRVLGTAPMGSLRTTGELYWPLVSGACLVLARPGGQQDVRYLAELAADEAVTVMNTTPSVLRLLIEEPAFARATGLRVLHCSAEPLPDGVFARFRAMHSARLRNVYGQTECAPVLAWEGGPSPVPGKMPLGRPTPAVEVALLDDDLSPVPDGETGEICVAGPSLALGHLEENERTAERFPRLPGGRRLLRTGDLARRDAQGVFWSEGRKDSTLGIAGFRVDPAEVEQALEKHPGIARCVVGLHQSPSGEPVLTAYVHPAPAEVSAPATPNTAALRAFLDGVLPQHMHPRQVVLVPAIPLLSSGKVDRASLGALPVPRSETSRPGGLDSTQALVARAMAEVLESEPTSPQDNFYDLGGTSLQLMRLVADLNRLTATAVDMARIAADPTVETVAAALGAARRPAG